MALAEIARADVAPPLASPLMLGAGLIALLVLAGPFVAIALWLRARRKRREDRYRL